MAIERLSQEQMDKLMEQLAQAAEWEKDQSSAVNPFSAQVKMPQVIALDPEKLQVLKKGKVVALDETIERRRAIYDVKLKTGESVQVIKREGVDGVSITTTLKNGETCDGLPEYLVESSC